MARVMTVAEARAESGCFNNAYAELADQFRVTAYVSVRGVWRSPEIAPPSAGFYRRRTAAGWVTRDWWDAEFACWRRCRTGVICANQCWPWAAQ